MEIEKKSPDITTLLKLMRDGPADAKREAGDQLFRLVEGRLRELAEMYLRREGRNNPILQPTLLITDAFQRLVGGKNINASDRRDFFAFARRVIPQILVDYFREFRAREGRAPHISLDGAGEVADPRTVMDLSVFQDVLAELEALDADQYRVVVDRFYLGRTEQEIADDIGKPLIWVRRKWKSARLWLHRRLTQENNP